jgi:zinc transport system substrate-binding protein
MTILKFIFALPVFLSVVMSVIFCSGCSSPQKGDKRFVFVSIPPQKYFVERIAGDRFTVFTLIGPGQNPHSFTPAPEQMARMSEASIYFRIGVESETAILPKISRTMAQLSVVDLRTGVEMLDMEEEHDHDQSLEHEHGENPLNHHDDHGGKDPHIWLSLSNVKIMSVTIKEALLKADPDGKDIYERNFQSFMKDIDSVDTYLKEILTPLKGSYLFVYHPAFGYFSNEYGLIQKAVETGGKEPGAKAIARLIDLAREYKPGVIFVQPQYSDKSARLIAGQIGCAVVSINPQPEDYLNEIKKMAEAIHAGYEK